MGNFPLKWAGVTLKCMVLFDAELPPPFGLVPGISFFLIFLSPFVSKLFVCKLQSGGCSTHTAEFP